MNNRRNYPIITITYVLFFVFFAFLIIKQTNVFNASLSHVWFILNNKKISNSSSPDIPIFESNFIPKPSYLLTAHSSTVIKLNDGRLLALWFAGSHEGKPDVNIWQSYYDNSKWSDATIVATRMSIENATKMFIRKLGNPVVYKALDGTLYLFIVSVSFGGWSGSSINQLMSHDGGKTWSSAKKLILSPFFNISTLIRTNGITLSNWGFYLPVYHESIRNYPEILYFDANGEFKYQLRISDTNHIMQPSILLINSTSAIVYFRNHVVNNLPLLYSITHDAGKTWSKLHPTNIYNQDSSLTTANLGNGTYLMVRNIIDRGTLSLAVSTDGIVWKDIYNLENLKYPAEFSYPSIVVDNGVVDILYTWQRKYIKHVRFNYPWLDNIMKSKK